MRCSLRVLVPEAGWRGVPVSVRSVSFSESESEAETEVMDRGVSEPCGCAGAGVSCAPQVRRSPALIASFVPAMDTFDMRPIATDTARARRRCIPPVRGGS